MSPGGCSRRRRVVGAAAVTGRPSGAAVTRFRFDRRRPHRWDGSTTGPRPRWTGNPTARAGGRPGCGAHTGSPDVRASPASVSGGRLSGLTFGDRRYPPRLAHIPDPPLVLWVAGTRRGLGSVAVALVGSRAGSPYACAVAERLASDLSNRGVTVVSGLVRGVDGAAHRGGLEGRGGTVGVLGCGLDVVYPPEHRQLISAVRSRGAVVSEFGPSVPPLRFNFPRRNRIISGLSVAVVVVEANDRSGSLITARCAAEQGREVMAVPGSVMAGRNRGGHALLRDGAKISWRR